MLKRLLFKFFEVNIFLKVKSKSIINILVNRIKLMKFKYFFMFMSLVNIDIGEGDEYSEVISVFFDKFRIELSFKFYQEFNKRKQATEFVQQLQLDYDKFLFKYVQVEFIIDQFRFGVNVTLYINFFIFLQVSQGVFFFF